MNVLSPPRSKLTGSHKDLSTGTVLSVPLASPYSITSAIWCALLFQSTASTYIFNLVDSGGNCTPTPGSVRVPSHGSICALPATAFCPCGCVTDCLSACLPAVTLSLQCCGGGTRLIGTLLYLIAVDRESCEGWGAQDRFGGYVQTYRTTHTHTQNTHCHTHTQKHLIFVYTGYIHNSLQSLRDVEGALVTASLEPPVKTSQQTQQRVTTWPISKDSPHEFPSLLTCYATLYHFSSCDITERRNKSTVWPHI